MSVHSQPSIRGILTSCAGIAVMLGFFIVYLLGSIITWRNVALICLSVPLATVVAICFVNQSTWIAFSFELINNVSCIRCLKLRCGCYRKNDQTMHWNHCSGYEDGCLPKMSKKNLLKCNATMCTRIRVDRARKRKRCVIIRRRLSFKSFKSSSESETYGRLFWRFPALHFRNLSA